MLQDFAFGLKVLLKTEVVHGGGAVDHRPVHRRQYRHLHGARRRGAAAAALSDDDRLLTLFNVYPGVGVTDRGPNGVPDYLDRRKMTGVFSEGRADRRRRIRARSRRLPAAHSRQYVTPRFSRRWACALARAHIHRGRSDPGKEKVAVLSEGLWKEQFARDPKVAGRDIRLNGNLLPHRGRNAGDLRGLPGDDVRAWVPVWPFDRHPDRATTPASRTIGG